MKFGEHLKNEAYPPWMEGYVRYDNLKHKIADGSFSSEDLRNEVQRLANYKQNLINEFLSKLETLELRWKDVRNWKRSGFPDVDREVEKVFQDFTTIQQQLLQFLEMTSLNITGIQKICKKSDRRNGEVTGPILLNKLQKDANSAYLNKLSDLQDLEILVRKVRSILDEIQGIRDETSKDLKKVFSHPLGPEYLSIPRSPRTSNLGSVSTISATTIVTSSENWADIIAQPLLCSNEPSPIHGDDFLIAFFGALLSGIGLGGFWTICEIFLDSWEAVFAVLLCSFGSITGSRPALSSLYYSTFAFAGALSSMLFSSNNDAVFSRRPYVNLFCCWMLGVSLGAWTVQIPRQMVSKRISSFHRMCVTLAPFFGACLSAALLIELKMSTRLLAQIYSICWGLFFVLLAFQPTQKETNHHEESEADSIVGDEENPQSQLSSQEQLSTWKRATSVVSTLGVLASLAVDRTVRTLVALEVISFFPDLEGEDFFLLSLGSLIAAVIGTTVPAWASAMMGFLSMFFLNGPGFFTWFWVEASCRADLAKCDQKSAPKADTVLYVADTIACILFAIELSSLTEEDHNRPIFLNYLSGILLLCSSFGRFIVSKI